MAELQMTRNQKLIAFAATFAFVTPDVGAESIANARYDTPVNRYGHYAAGRPHEYAELVATTDAGRTLALRLPEEEVFEDLEPRLVRLAAGGSQKILAIVSARANGSRLMLLEAGGDRLRIIAQSAAIGTPNRWLNPVGVADLDGDGSAEIAAVTTPHIGGVLRVYRLVGSDLVEIAALAGFSNHVYGSSELRLSTLASIAGRTQILLPDGTRRHLRIIALKAGNLVETGRCELRSPATGPIRLVSSSQVSVSLDSGQQVIALKDCLKNRNRNAGAT